MTWKCHDGWMPARRSTSADSTSPAPDRRPDPDHVARVLAVDRDETLRRLGELTADFDELVAASVSSNADDEHDPEGSTIAFERSQVDALVQQAKHHLDEVEAAAARIADGTYGVCETCGRPIPAERLEARPVARTCVGCAPARPAGPARSVVRSHGRDRAGGGSSISSTSASV
jgi:DnaK suppressor protein